MKKQTSLINLILTIVTVLLILLVLVGCQQQPTPSPAPPSAAQTPAPIPPPKPAEFVASNLSITPDEVEIGASVTIEVTVTNIGELSGAYEVNLMIDDTIEDTKKVTIDGGECQKVTFTKTNSVAKTYSVCIGDLVSSFVVKASQPPAEPDTSSSSIWTFWGPATFGTDYPATSGTIIRVTDMKPATCPEEKSGVNISLSAVGLPEDKVYYLWSKGLGQSSPTKILPVEMSITSDGSIIPKGSTSPMSLTFCSFAKGEARVIALMTEDKSIIAYGKVMPYPIQVTQGNSRIWVELMSTTGDLFAIHGVRFEPNEELEITSDSEGEVAKYKSKADGNGHFINVLLPAVVGKESGVVTYTVASKAGTLTVSFEWGPPALRSGP